MCPRIGRSESPISAIPPPWQPHPGAKSKAVQRMIGHKSAAKTLEVYADLFEVDLTL